MPGSRTLRGVLSRLAIAGALAGLAGGLFAAAPAAAAEHTAVLQISATVTDDTLAPGETLTYRVAVDCLTDDCVGARVVDVLPPEFDELALDPTVVVTGGPSTYSWGGENDRALTVDFTKPTPGGAGIPSGEGYSIQVSLQVPPGLSPDWEWNGVPVTNTATVSAATAATVSASVAATVTVPFSVAATAGAGWSPPTTQFKVGESSTLTLSGRNTSNARAEHLTLLLPTDPSAASNLFERVTFDGFGALVFPGGADRVRVDAFAAGAWVEGEPAAFAALPEGVLAADVTGLRLVFSAAEGALTANGAAASVEVDLAQRATTRTGGVSLVTGATVTAQTRATAAVAGHGSSSADASATYTIGGLTSAVSGMAAFASERIPAGGGTVATLTGRNASNGNLAVLAVALPAGGFLSEKVTFGGFRSSGAAWPAGATGATLTWFLAGGENASVEVGLDAGAAFPAPPVLSGGERIAGFELRFRGALPVGATAAVPFRVDVAADAVPADPGTGAFALAARIDGSNDAGDADPATPGATLTVLYPQVDVALTKTITPTKAVPAGGRSIVQLRATTSSDSGYVAPVEVVITDAMTDAEFDYWQAFDVVAVAPTQVPAGAKLVIEATTDGAAWAPIGEVVATGAAIMHQQAIADRDIVGIRFVFTNAEGFGQGTTLQGNLAFSARAERRDGTGSTAGGEEPVVYANHATATATGDVVLDGGTVVGGSSAGSGSGSVKPTPGGGAVLIFGKSWVPVSGSTTVASQSGQTRTARLSWGVEVSGFPVAQVSDPDDPTAPVAQTVFQAFDLSRIEAITTSTDPLIAYDQVTDVELYVAGAWTSIHSTVCATAAACLGRFPGYTLTAQQRAAATGVRLTFAEYPEGRVDDPLAPPLGSGVASGPDGRRLDLVFQIRNTVRDAAALSDPTDPWVTADRAYHWGDAGVIVNAARLALGDAGTTSSASIQILDPVPSTTFTNTQLLRSGSTTLSSPVPIAVPGDVAVGDYPTVRYSLAATNASAARAWYLRVTDQMPCTTEAVSACAHATSGGIGGWTVNPYQGRTWDPATSPFEYLTIRDINYTLSSNSGISAANSTVTLWYQDGSTQTVSLATANGMTESALLDVVGVSALFAGSSTTDGGTIASGATATLVLETRLRKNLRSDPGKLVAPTTVTNSAFAQVWDGVLPDTDAYSSRSQSFQLVDASLAVTAAKSATVTSILEANRTADSTVTLTATQGTSTASPTRVTLEDTASAFWNAFELRSLGTISRPAGADRARVDVQLDGGSDWTLGTAAASPVLPAGVTASRVTGLRVVFFRADGGIFSVTSPAASWTGSAAFTVRLRATYRDSGTAIAFPSSVSDFVTNTVTTTAEHPTLGTATATATRVFRLDPGTFKVDVEKRAPVPTTPAGETLDFSLIVKNTGTGYLDNPVVTDQLPLDGALLFDPTSEVLVATSSGGILPTTGVTVSHDPATARVTVRWPAGSRLAPGETATITLPLQVKPGLSASYGTITNTFTFSSDRTLASAGNQGCTNLSGGRGATYDGGKGCRTTAVVSTIAASAISSFKGVKGDVDELGVSTSGAVNVNHAGTACVADPQGFYRNPCAAISRLGATDLWKLQFTNGGNVAATEATIVDVLPRSGDAYLGTGAARGSTYRPVFAGDLRLLTDTVGGTTFTWQVTTTANPCPAFMTDSLCSAATWVDGATFPATDFGKVTALRVRFTFPGGELPPAATLAVGYATTNLPTTTAGDGRVPVTVPMATQRAWNSFGVFAKFGAGFADRRVEPVRAGVQLASGPIQVVKEITGDAAAFAPTSFAATVGCTVDATGTALTLPAGGAVSLAASGATPYTTRLDGIPLGSTCAVTETTTGASSVAYAPAAGSGPPRALLAVATAAAPADPVPVGQVATITNSYGTTQLTIAKAVSTSATVGGFGPFAFTLACSADRGSETVTVPLDEGDASFTLADGASRTITGLPVTARCDLRETDSDGATTIAMSTGGGSATTVARNAAYRVTLGTQTAYSVAVTNTFDSGTLAIRKELAGGGGEAYGADDYGFDVECTYQGDVVFTAEDVRVAAGETHEFDVVLPVGTSCAIAESDAGGATTAAEDASVTIATGTTTALMTNRFDTGSIRVHKVRTGAWERYGAGPFEAQVACTWDAPGAAGTVIPLPGSGLVELSAENGYSATVTGLIAGADCTVTETKTGGATTTEVGEVGAVTAEGVTVVEVENAFSTGSLRIVKVRDIDEGAEEFADGPFEVLVECGLEIDGEWTGLDLGDDATQILDARSGFEATVGDLLQGASCTVTETDAGLADSHESSTDEAAVVIPPGWTGPALAVVTNHFRTGELDVEKTVEEALVQGGESLHYAITVENVGDVVAGGVTVTDELDDDLRLDPASLAADGWECELSGADADGFGGTLLCELQSPLGLDATAPGISFTAEVRGEVSQDEIVNTAVAASTTVVVAGDEDSASTPVKWLAVDAGTECVLDAPWLTYSIDAHNLEVGGRTLTVLWKNADGDVVHTDEIEIEADGTITGRLLFPGAAIDDDGRGVAWPGWRPAEPGETPQWENLVLDPDLPGYGLREGASVEFLINPARDVAISYPPPTPSCAEAPVDQESALWMSKDASANVVAAGDRFDYTIRVGNDGRGAVRDLTLVDEVPGVLRILEVLPAEAERTQPAWRECVVGERQANGYGGTITCELDRDLGFGQRTPDVLIRVQLSPYAKAGPVINTARVTAFEVPSTAGRGEDPELVTLALEDSAAILTPGRLAATGWVPAAGIQIALALLTLGGFLLALRRRRSGTAG